MSAWTLLAGRSSASLSISPFLDLVSTGEVPDSVRRLHGSTSRRVAEFQSGYRSTAVGNGPWRLTHRGSLLVRAAVVLAILLAGFCAVAAGLEVGRATSLVGVPEVPDRIVSDRGTFSDAAVTARSEPAALESIATSRSTAAETADTTEPDGGLGAAQDSVDWVVVQPGDTLWDIATRANPAGDPREMLVRIREANGSSLSQLVAGQRVRLPSRDRD